MFSSQRIEPRRTTAHTVAPRPADLQSQLTQWGFTKNLKRGEVVEILRAKASRDTAGKESVFTLRGRPVSLEQVEKHRKKFGIPAIKPGSLSASHDSSDTSSQDIVCRTPPPSPHASLPVVEARRVPEKLLYDIDVLVKGSFEAGRWKFVSNDLLIVSSEHQTAEKLAIHDFLGNIINASATAKRRDYDLAFERWSQACVKVDRLVTGRCHDIIPNLIQQLNDLNREDLGPVAASLKKYIAEASAVHGDPNEPTTTILSQLGKLDMSLVAAAEERIMAHFHRLFTQYLGYRCYNTFVMMMDGARRRLLYDKWATFTDCLPSLAHLDTLFGPTDRRPLDMIGLRLEILKDRGIPAQAEREAAELIRRAENIENDDWQRAYHLTRGWYFRGWAQYSMPGKRGQAVESFETAMRCDDELCAIDDFHIFVPERVAMVGYLRELRGAASGDSSVVGAGE